MLNKERDELTRQEIYDLVETAKHLGFLEVVYFGGEPLMREDITDLIRFSSSRGLLTSIYTNGILLSRKFAKELRDAGLFYCNVSLDSSSPEQHNRLRGYKGCFEKAEEGIKYLTEAGVQCSIWTYVKKEDVKDGDLLDLKALIEKARQLKVRNVVILFPIASGNWLCGAKSVLRLLHDPPFVAMEFPKEDAHCCAGDKMVYITPQGAVSPCPTIPHFFGDIRKEPFVTILERMYKDFVETKVGGCGECVMNQNTFREKIGMNILEKDQIINHK